MTDTVEDRLARVEQALIYLAANHPEELVFAHVQRVVEPSTAAPQTETENLVGLDEDVSQESYLKHCDCSCADKCPQGRLGSEPRCVIVVKPSSLAPQTNVQYLRLTPREELSE